MFWFTRRVSINVSAAFISSSVIISSDFAGVKTASTPPLISIPQRISLAPFIIISFFGIQNYYGDKKEIIINRLKANDMSKFQLADGECSLNGCIFEIDNKTGKTVNIERICI